MKTILQYATEIDNNDKRVSEVESIIRRTKEEIKTSLFPELVRAFISNKENLVKRLLKIQENNISNLKIATEFAHSKLSIQKRFIYDS